MKYNPGKIESKWKKLWLKKKIYEPDLKNAERPFYTLMMFPYPSAEGLHIGGVRTFTGVDIYGRFKRMQGYDVFEPIGLDGFGIHSENYALKIGKHPTRLVPITEKNFYRQLVATGNAFSWDEALETYDPDYYRWTQWIFIQMFKRGLAYRKKAKVNWCPSCLTVLADEQVVSGECERCGSPTIKKDLEQWFFKITDYAERLLNNLPKLDWSENIKIAQEHWIGRSEGALIKFPILDSQISIEVFTTRPDTLFGATYMVVAPEHPLVETLKNRIQNWKEAEKYISAAAKRSEIERTAEGKEKTGVELKGVRAINPANKEEIPVYIADYVLFGYGTGAVMAVPAHDARDYAFAKKFNIPAPVVIDGGQEEMLYVGAGRLINSGKFSSMQSDEAKRAITEFVGGTLKVQYRLRDWLISRQRYWGPPIPMIFCGVCEKAGMGERKDALGWYTVPESELPVRLPFVKDFRPKGTGESPLASVKSFYEIPCPKCHKPARRETDVSDTFLDSAWYFLRYPSVSDSRQAWNSGITNRWLPVHMYIGGAEHAVLHLLYARFLTMVFYDWKLVGFEEPFTTFRAHGLITKGGAKMSKSKGNVVNPDDYFKRYGADTMRMYLAFLAPFAEGGDFQDSGIAGITRFLNRVWEFSNAHAKKTSSEFSPGDEKVIKSVHKAVKKVTEDIAELHYNTAISALMVLLNEFEAKPAAVNREDVGIFLKLLAPFAPFITEELWQKFFADKKSRSHSIHLESWPAFDKKLIVDETVVVVVQVNGVMRDKFEIKNDASEEEVRTKVLSLEKVKHYVPDVSKIKKFIYIKNKIANIVLQ